MKYFLISVLCCFCSVCTAGQWSQYPSCDSQYTKDTTACNSISASDKAKRQACWSSASDRLAKCNASKGVTLNSPTLQK